MLLPISAAAQDNIPRTYAYTFQNASGNRYLPDAAGTFPDVEVLDVPLDAVPLWVVGGLVDGAPAWAVALERGRVIAVDTDGSTQDIGTLAPGQPFSLTTADGTLTLITAGDDLSPLSTPVMLADGGTVYAAANGDLVLWRDGHELDRAALALQPDAVPVISDAGQVAVYAAASDTRYVHGIMGDDLEGSQLVVLSVTDSGFEIAAQVELPGADVFEGISPLWADVDDDGAAELVATVSNGDSGAWLRVYEANGDVLANSRVIGQGFRWRHQLAVAPFGINSETQIADVRTPHIGGMVEFLSLDGAALVVNNAQLGYTSHVIGSRNLDMGLAGDFDGSGKPELVITDQARQNVIGVENTLQGVAEVWRLPLDGTLTANFAAVRLPDGTFALAAGTDRASLRVWLPR